MRRIHGYATIFWILMIVPSIVWFRSSVTYLVMLSVYAVIMGHWSSWQSSRVEVVQYEDASVQEVLDEIKQNE
jgi:hypothetical protein